MVIIDVIKDGFFVEVTKQEAIEIIKSLSAQLANNNPNTNRKEHSNPYFSIAVI